MGILDAISKEDRVEVTYSDFYSLMKEATKAELLMNGVKQQVSHEDMYAMMTGEEHPVVAEMREKGMLTPQEFIFQLMGELLCDDDDEPCEGCCCDCDHEDTEKPAEENEGDTQEEQ